MRSFGFLVLLFCFVSLVDCAGGVSPSGVPTETGNAAAKSRKAETLIRSFAAPLVLAINAGGSASGSYIADTDYSGSGTYSSSTTHSIDTSLVANPAPTIVYQTARNGSGPMTYTLPGLVAGQSYTLRLHFAEHYFSQSGKRVFNVSVNNQTWLANFDVFQAAGAEYKAIAEQTVATADVNGKITIAFTPVTNYPIVNGLDVSAASAATPPPFSTSYTNANPPPAGWNPLGSTGLNEVNINWPQMCSRARITCQNGDPPYLSNLATVVTDTLNPNYVMLFHICTSAGYTGTYNGSQGSQSCQSGADESIGTFFAAASDPSYTMTVVVYPPGGFGPSGTGGTFNGQAIHIPNGFLPNLSNDHHGTVIDEVNHVECDLWRVGDPANDPPSYAISPLSGGGALNVANGSCGKLDIHTEGQNNYFVGIADGRPAAVYLLRAEDILGPSKDGNGVLTHALYLSVSNNKPGFVYPAAVSDGHCSGQTFDVGQEGYRYYLDTAGYNVLLASAAPAWKKTLLAAFHFYTAVDSDTSGCSSLIANNYTNALAWGPMMYTQSGINNPWDDFINLAKIDTSDVTSNGDQYAIQLNLAGTGLTYSSFHVLKAGLDQCLITNSSNPCQ